MSDLARDAGTDIRIRLATAQDCAAIRTVASEAWAATYASTIAPHNQHAFLQQAYSDGALAQQLQRPGGRLVVAEVGQRVVAYAASLERTPEAAELQSLYVLPEHQGQGVGSALLRHEMARLAERGIQVLLVSVLRENERARRFYEHHGFQAFSQDTAPVGDQQIVEVVYGRWVRSE